MSRWTAQGWLKHGFCPQSSDVCLPCRFDLAGFRQTVIPIALRRRSSIRLSNLEHKLRNFLSLYSTSPILTRTRCRCVRVLANSFTFWCASSVPWSRSVKKDVQKNAFNWQYPVWHIPTLAFSILQSAVLHSLIRTVWSSPRARIIKANTRLLFCLSFNCSSSTVLSACCQRPYWREAPSFSPFTQGICRPPTFRCT